MGRSKYNVDQNVDGRTCDGIVFDSAIEMRYYQEVVLPGVESGEITSFELQKKYELQPAFQHDAKKVQAINYIADFVLTFADGQIKVIDTKGFPDATAKLKRKLFWYHYPDLDYEWVSYSKIDGGWVPYEKLVQLRKERRKSKCRDQ